MNTQVISLQRGWKFCYGDVKRWERVDHDTCYLTTKTGYEFGTPEVFLNENDWIDVGVPHDWNTAQASDPTAHPNNGFKPRGIGWYYIKFDMPEYSLDSHVLLEFEGIMGESVVYVNGILAARSETGYTAFSFDVSDYLLPGEENMIVVSVDNTRWEGWWYEGAGIYRPVQLYINPTTHFKHMGTFVRAELKDEVWTLKVSTEIETAGGEDVQAAIHSRVLDAEGNCVLELDSEACVPAYGAGQAFVQAKLDGPELWSCERPYLYTLENTLVIGGEVIQTEATRFGVRDIQWTDHGMYLNGKLTPVRGICCHQDHVGVGIAVTKSLTRYRVGKLKAMGCNAYRSAHHCPSKYLLEVCDEMGMLFMAENRHYRATDEVLAQLDALTMLCRNHPCVFLYSLFNEEAPWQSHWRGRRIAEKMLRRIRQKDDTRAVTAAMNGGVLAKENASDILDVAGMNYFIDDYMKYAERRPGHPMIGTENSPLYATRGIYKSDEKAQVYDCYGLTTAFFAQLLQDTIEKVEEAPHVAGQFVWGGFDYRGEPQPFEWPSVFSHWGLTDNCGFEKDTAYMLHTYYSDADELMVHLLPHWNWSEGETIRVCAMTNCDTVQLFVNDKPLEERKVIRKRAEWQVPFEAGRIHVVAKAGNRVLTDTIYTTGNVAKLEVVDAAPKADYDSSILNICLQDATGLAVPGRENDRMVHFEILKGELIGAGNGNPNGIQPDITEDIETFCGRCQAIVRPDEESRVHVIVSCDGLEDVEYVR